MAALRFGLVASRLHRQPGTGGLAHWLHACDAGVRALRLGLHAVGETHDALVAQGLLAGHGALVRLPPDAEGGVMRLASGVAGGQAPHGNALDGAIHLMDPADPSALYPEAQALKRQCVIHGKPFIPTVAGAIEWIAVERAHAGVAPWPGSLPKPEQQTVALIAHDAFKDQMVGFAATHFDLLSRFASRIGTGTTGSRLNAMAWSRGWPAGQAWVQPYLSGPLGGDAQIAERVLDRRCQKVIFFEDPHVARQHEADIQLLERAVCIATEDTTCINSPAMAQRWAEAMV